MRTLHNPVLGDEPWELDVNHPEACDLLGWYFQRYHTVNSVTWDGGSYAHDASLYGIHGIPDPSFTTTRPTYAVVPGTNIVGSDHTQSSFNPAWEIADHTRLLGLTDTDGCTISAWIYLETTVGGNQYVWSRGTAFQNGTMGLWFNGDEDLKIVVNATSGGNLFGLGSYTVSTGVPIHVCCTYHTDECNVYVNGQQEDNHVATRTIPGVAGSMWIGGRAHNNSAFKAGLIWDLRCYAGVKDDNFIQRIADSDNPGPRRFLRDKRRKYFVPAGGGGGTANNWYYTAQQAVVT